MTAVNQMRIIDLKPDNKYATKQAAKILYEGFKDIWPNICPDVDAAAQVVQNSFDPGKICRMAVNDDGEMLGWIGAVADYDGNAWCLYPLAVHPDFREQGVGRTLVADLETQVRERGGITIYLGTDDTLGMTSLGGVDLYPNVIEHISHIRNLQRHPFEFYQKLGYAIVGVIPDANGFGKPDIFMAKRLIDGRKRE